MLRRQSKRYEALEMFQQALEYSRQLATIDEKDARAKNDLASGYFFIGEIQMQLNRFQEAAQSFDAAAAVLQEMINKKMLVQESKGKLETVNGLATKCRALAEQQAGSEPRVTPDDR